MPIEKLNRSERLYLSRRRRRESQSKAAKRLRVKITLYRLWESGEETSGIPDLKVGKLEPHERCHMLRRRSDVNLATVARKLGRCRWWVSQMERGEVSCEELVEYWAA